MSETKTNEVEKLRSTLDAVIGVVFFFPLWIGYIVLKGFVFSTLWFWFIVPTFRLPALSIPIACGISLTFALLTWEYKSSKDQTISDVITKMLYSMVGIMLALVIGWIITWFI